MSSSGKKKTTMAKRAREQKLRERRLDKQARKDARKAAALLPDSSEPGLDAAATEDARETPRHDALGSVEETPKDFSLRRLRDAPDEELALFEGTLRQDALAAGATEQELREAQSGRPEHG
jgi:hypothetical protein